MGTITLAQLWCDGICVPTLRLFDAIEGGSDLSTSDHEDTAGIGCESTWTWFYGTAMIFLWGIVPIRMDRLFVVFGMVKLP